MTSKLHSKLNLVEIHAFIAATYTTIAERDADTAWNTDSDNQFKVVYVVENEGFYVLRTSTPAQWTELTSTEVDTFIELQDTPSNYTGAAGKGVRVNALADGLEFGDGQDGDVVGPASSIDNQVAIFNGTDGKAIEGAPGAIISDAGDLTITGAFTHLATPQVTILDENIELGVVGTPTDITADTGGITVKGTTDKTIEWLAATDSWTFNKSIDAEGHLTVQGITTAETQMTVGSAVIPATDASIDLKANDKALLLNRMTTVQRDALTPAEGMAIYNLDTHDMETYNNTAWESAAGGDVVGSSSSLDNQLTRYNGLSGKNIHPAPGAFIHDDGYFQIQNTAANVQLGELVDSVGNGVMFTSSSDGANIGPSVSSNNLHFGADKPIGNIIVNTGNVGLKTNTPEGDLQINGDQLMWSGVGNNAPRPPVAITRIDGEISGVGSNIGSDDGFMRLSAGGGTNVITKAYIDISGYSQVPEMATNIVFGTQAVERERITWQGYHGIGTKDPQEKLSVEDDVAGKGRISVNETGVSGSNSPGFMLKNKGDFKGGIFYNEATNTIQLYDFAAPQLYYNANGLGIQCSPNPDSQLRVNGTAKFYGGINGEGSLVSETDTLILGNSGAPSLVGIKDFNFGIGTNNPTSRMHVVGNALIETYANILGYAIIGSELTSSPDASLALGDTDKSLNLNNVSTATREGYSTPVNGMFHQNSDMDTPECYNGTRERWETVKSQNVVYVNSQDDLPTPQSGWIELEDYTTYVGNDGLTTIALTNNLSLGVNTRVTNMVMTTTGRITSQGNWELRNCSITSLSTGLLLDMGGMVGIGQVVFTTFYMPNGGTLFNIDSGSPTRILIFNNVGAVGAGTFSMGTINAVEFNVTGFRAYGFNDGLVLNDTIRILLSDFITVGANSATTHLTIDGTNQGSIQISGFTPTVGSNEYAFYFDPATEYNGPVSVSNCTVDDADRVFQPGSVDQTVVGFKFLGNTNIPDSTANIHLLAPTIGTQTTDLTQGEAKRINATYVEFNVERFEATGEGNMGYLGRERATFQVNATITGTVSSGTNIDCNFYIAKNTDGLLITSMQEYDHVIPGWTYVTTNQAHLYQTQDKILIEGTAGGYYDGEYEIQVVLPDSFAIQKVFTVTSEGVPSRLSEISIAQNTFSSTANKNTGLVTLESMGVNDFIFLCVENVDTSADWSHKNIQVVLTKV